MSKNRTKNTLTVSSALSDLIINGFNDKSLERIGGALVLAGTKEVIALISGDENAKRVMSIVGDAAHYATQASKPVLETIGASTMGVGSLPLAVLSLGVVQMEFAVLLKRVTNIERRLQETQALLEQVNRKLDLGFYSNFCAALDLASRAFTMGKLENRNDAAWQAVNRLAEARRHYSKLADYEISARSKLAREYLATLLLAYAAEIRCYLEMGEPQEAIKLLKVGIGEIYPRVQFHVNTLLTSNRSAYLHPALKGTIDLRRLTKVLQWFEPTLDENAVFEQQRGNFFNLTKTFDGWVRSLPPAVWDPLIDLQPPTGHTPTATRSGLLNLNNLNLGKWFGRGPEETKIFPRLAETFDAIEAMIEDMGRFQAYEMELQVMEQLGLSFSGWKQSLTAGDTNGGNLFVIGALEPMNLKLTSAAPVTRASVH
jgi:tetratricopeptide (TPR) repeat protein